MDKIKKYLPWITYAGLGLLTFILWAFPYYKWRSEWAVFLGGRATRVVGYRLLGLWSGGVGGVMSSLMQLFILLVFIALIAVGVLGLLNRFGITKIKEQYGKFTLDKIGTLLLYAYVALNFLLLIFLIIFTASNSEKFDGARFGPGLSAGVFITLIIGGGVLALRIYLNKKYPAGTDAQPVVVEEVQAEDNGSV
ncbi:MAG: hypothetical protein FWE62_01475 [Firmicutes bacterium]|nr:hypothetical protein [Bacillota bacterium]